MNKRGIRGGFVYKCLHATCAKWYLYMQHIHARAKWSIVQNRKHFMCDETRSHSNRSNHRMNASATLLDRVVQTPAPPACTPTLTCCRRSTTTTIIKASLFSLLRALFLPLYTNTQASKPSLSLVNTIQISLSLSVSLSHWEQCFFL